MRIRIIRLDLALTLSIVACGLSPQDWCESPPWDACGKHKNITDCRADRRCVGMRYRGESAIACEFDSAGFGTNCPTVGCVTRCETLSIEDCPKAAERCAAAIDGSCTDR